jgi:hypothetical protein
MLAALPLVSSAQQTPARDSLGTIAGRVVDATTSEPRAGASVSIVGTGRGAIADTAGRFVIPNVVPATLTVRARLFGYRPIDREIVVRRGDTTRVEFRLEAEAAVLSAVRTEARPIERDQFEARPNVGTVSITGRAMQGVPKFGELDVIRVVQLLPGVEARNDFSTGFNVRGGESDQNLILLDGHPIYNPFHLGGLFSTFIDATVRDVTLMTGGFPARYGGRLSSVLDVQSTDDPRSGIHGDAEVSLIASTAALSGAFGGGKGSWMLAGRRTYADKFVALISDNNLPYHFRDEQGRLSYTFANGAKLALTLYDGRDVLDANIAALGDSSANAGKFVFTWGNQIAGAALTKTMARRPGLGWLTGDSLSLEQRASMSRFATNLDLGEGSLLLSNRVRDLRLSGSATARGKSHDRSFGYDVASYGIDYNARSAEADADLYQLRQAPTSLGAYVDDLWRVSPKVLIQAGGRIETLTGSGWTNVSPRVSAKYFLTPDRAVTGAVGRFSQWTHSLAREDIPVRLFDFWVASDGTTPVSTAWHYLLGTEHWLSRTRYLRVEGFYKKYDRLLESNPAEDPANRGDEFFVVGGHSYGADFLLREFEAGPFSGWIAYTYAVSSRRRDSTLYFPGHDRRHDVNIVGSWRLRKYVLGARYGYATGTPYTEIIAQIVRRVYDPAINAWGTRGSGSRTEFVGGPRNAARLPSTQRLDLSVTRNYLWRGATIAPYLSVVNAYNAKNVFIYVFDYTNNPPTRTAISQFPLLPSAGVTVSW